jgi:hypothetical protein
MPGSSEGRHRDHRLSIVDVKRETSAIVPFPWEHTLYLLFVLYPISTTVFTATKERKSMARVVRIIVVVSSPMYIVAA